MSSRLVMCVKAVACLLALAAVVGILAWAFIEEGGGEPPSNDEGRITIGFVNRIGDAVEHAASFSDPRPRLRVGIGNNLRAIIPSDLTITQTPGNPTALVHVTGEVLCDIADVVANRSGDITAVTVEMQQVNTTGQFSATTASVKNISSVPCSAYVPTLTSEQVHPFVGRFETDVRIPLATGSMPVIFKTENAIGRSGYASFSVHVNNMDLAFNAQEQLTNMAVLPEYISGVEMHSSTPGDLFNPIWVRIGDTSSNPAGSAQFFGAAFPLIAEPENSFRIDRPFIQVGKPLKSSVIAPNVLYLVEHPETSVATYKTAHASLNWTFTTASSPRAFLKYAAGTTVRHKWYNDQLNPGWAVDRLGACMWAGVRVGRE